MTLSLPAAEDEMVRNAPIFSDISREDVQALLEAAYVTNHVEGELLFSRGDPADRFFLVLAGRVNLFALTEAGDQSILEVIEKGQSFAEAAIFASQRFPINAECQPGTRLLEIPSQPFLARLSERRGLSAKLLGSLARWQRRMLSEIAELKGRSPVQRLGLFLLAQVRAAGLDEESEAALTLPVTKVQLASRIGITPESLSRALARLRPLGVSSSGRDFTIADPRKLRAFCGAD
ncbi:MAG TPA: cyclic nucleotide-binding domain-containing protein [Candidatus Sulfotelmatobacter sp.]|jgi:CRP-like cAMP-binding protein|nr:cyclic nucleotide-binding domain-containing protein [Candidatus Sulfotelmatobacter sp.]